MTILIFNVG